MSLFPLPEKGKENRSAEKRFPMEWKQGEQDVITKIVITAEMTFRHQQA